MNYILLILSVLVGSGFVLLINPSKKFTQLLLAFSGAYLLSVTILHLLPELYHDEHSSIEHNSNIIGILILTGILFQSVLESFSKGAEHGHIHIHQKKRTIPWTLFISLCVHAFSEGLPIHHENHNLLWAIIVHKIPIAIVLTSFLLKSKFSKKTIILFLAIFSIMSPLGHLLSNKVNFITENSIYIIALTVGFFLHISTIILFESNENHQFNLKKFLVIIVGILLTVFTL